MPSIYPQLNQDPFKTGGVMDRPDLQTRKAALMARLGQALSPMDATRLAQREGLEQENAFQAAGGAALSPGQNPMMAGLPQQQGGIDVRSYTGSMWAPQGSPMAARALPTGVRVGDPFQAGLAPQGTPVSETYQDPSAFVQPGMQPSQNSIFNSLQGTGADPAIPVMNQALGFHRLAQGQNDVQTQKAQLGLVQTQQKLAQNQIENDAIAAAHAPGVEDGLATYLERGGRDMKVIGAFRKAVSDEGKQKLAADAAAAKAEVTKQKAADAAAKQEQRDQMMNESADLVMGNIDKIIPIVEKWSPGILAANARNLEKNLKGSEVANVEELKKPILANIATDKLQAMREASKTGASGFGALSVRELELLEASRGSLESAQDPAQLKQAYSDIRKHFAAWKLAYEAGKQASAGTLSPQDQAKAILAIRAATKK